VRRAADPRGRSRRGARAAGGLWRQPVGHLSAARSAGDGIPARCYQQRRSRRCRPGRPRRAPALARKARMALQRSTQRPLDGNRGGIHRAVGRSGHRVARSRVLCRGCDAWRAGHDGAPQRVRRRAGPRQDIASDGWRWSGRPLRGSARHLGRGAGDRHCQLAGKGRARLRRRGGARRQLPRRGCCRARPRHHQRGRRRSHRRGRFRRQPCRDAALPAGQRQHHDLREQRRPRTQGAGTRTDAKKPHGLCDVPCRRSAPGSAASAVRHCRLDGGRGPHPLGRCAFPALSNGRCAPGSRAGRQGRHRRRRTAAFGGSDADH